LDIVDQLEMGTMNHTQRGEKPRQFGVTIEAGSR
ncbi:hypothetical protein PSYPI_47106, partial [Pseudomonas syringae pv. pisi str. 1704B]